MSERPMPQPSPLTQGFWDGIRAGHLVIQQCDDCAKFRHYPQYRCAACGSSEWHWEAVSGRGVIYSLSVAHHPFHPAWKGRTPYVVATIDLEEGVRMVSELPYDDPELVAIGMAVEVVLSNPHDEAEPLPIFRLA